MLLISFNKSCLRVTALNVTIDTLTYATGIGIRPRACVSMYVNYSGLKWMPFPANANVG